MNVLFEHFNTILPITDKEIKEFTPLLRPKTLAKDDFLLRQNQSCNFTAFIAKGSFRSFHVKSNGNASNLMLNAEHEFFGNYESYLSGMPSTISIQAIEASEVILVYKQDLDKLLENSLYWNKFARIMTENIFMVSKLRLESIIYKTPKERYLHLINHSPEFLEKYSLTDIASFIGVTIQSLSRIRANL